MVVVVGGLGCGGTRDGRGNVLVVVCTLEELRQTNVRAGQGMVKLVDVIGIKDWGWFGTMGRRMRTDSKYSTSRGQLIVA